MRKLLFLFLFFICVKSATAQQLTGFWEGILYNDSTGQNYIYDIAISEKNGKLSGFSRTGFIIDDQIYFGVKKLSLKKIDGKILIKDEYLISNDYPIAPPKGIGQLSVLQLSVDGADSILAGEFSTNATKKYSPVTGSLRLIKKNGIKNAYLLPHLAELGLDKDLSFLPADAPASPKPLPVKEKSTMRDLNADLSKRKDVIQQQISFSSDSLYFSLYDNGEVDGDTVTVFLNDKPILINQGLSTKALKYSLSTKELGSAFSIKMFAETLGTIPPNTGLLIVQDGKQRHEIRFSGNLEENAVVEFKRQGESKK